MGADGCCAAPQGCGAILLRGDALDQALWGFAAGAGGEAEKRKARECG